MWLCVGCVPRPGSAPSLSAQLGAGRVLVDHSEEQRPLQKDNARAGKPRRPALLCQLSAERPLSWAWSQRGRKEDDAGGILRCGRSRPGGR